VSKFSVNLAIAISITLKNTKSLGDLIMRLSSIALIGGALLSVAVNVAPAFAGELSSSATFTTPAGFTSTVSAKVVLPAGAFFLTPAASVLTIIPSTPPIVGLQKASLSNAAVIAVPQFSLQGFSVAIESLSVGSNGVVTILPGASFTAAAATVLTSAAAADVPSGSGATFSTTVGGVTSVIYRSTNIEFIAAIIKAGAGVSGLD
jgi:hypothetical protein